MQLRFLFVEDNADDAEFMLRRLRDAGFELRWDRVETEAALREALGAERWDLALVDYHLPGFGGIRALNVLAEAVPDVPAITVSGAIDEDTAVATIKAGAVDYILKDDLIRLAPAVQRAVDGAELRRRQKRSAEAARLALFALDNASLSIMTVVADGTVVNVNDFACDEFGARREDLVGAKQWEFDEYSSAAGWPARWQAVKDLRAEHFEVERLGRDGRRRIFDVTTNYLEGAECLIGYGRDVTDERFAEEQARESAAVYRRIVETAGEGVWALGGEHRTTFVNAQMAAMLGYDVEEMIGRPEYLHSISFPIAPEGKQLLVGGLSIDVAAQVEAQDEVRRQAEQLARTVEGAVLAMSHVVEPRDPSTAGHERRVSKLATALAAALGVEGEALTALRLGGSGYPRALAGEEILPAARILAVADVVEAMSSHRPYRAALGIEAALAEVKEHAGVNYDAEVVAACVRLFEEQGFALTV